MNPLTRRLSLAVLISCSGNTLAHDPGLSSSIVRIGADAIVATVEFNNADFARMLPAIDRDGNGAIAREELAVGAELCARWFSRNTRLSWGGAPIVPANASVTLGEEEDVTCKLIFERDLLDGALEWSVPALQRLARGHRQYAAVINAEDVVVAEHLLTTSERAVAADLGAQAQHRDTLGQAVQFLHLGVEHILIGYDHILFLLGLLFVCGRWRHVVVTVTMFTLAHSITLVGASFGVIQLPGALVEATIAASIVFVGIKNLVRRGAPEVGAPWLVTFAFGLLHGFGFASVLGNLGVEEAGGVVVPVLAFNVGVEVGQMLIAGVALPILWRIARRPAAGRRLALFGSSVITIAGLFWLIERTLLA